MSLLRHLPSLIASLAAALSLASTARAGVFPTGAGESARLEITDATGGLSWVPATNALTVACWVKLTVPSDATISGDMTILGNRRTSDWSQPHAYRFYFNPSTGNIEFSARGTSGTPLVTIALVEKPYLDRWYHLTVVRSGDTFTPYLDGRQRTAVTQAIGSSTNTDGVTIGALSAQQRFMGEVQEVAIYQQALTRSLVVTNMLRDIPAASFPQLKGYYKLAYSTVAADNLKNFAAAPPAGTDPAVKQGTGTVDFPETDKQGEQSLFDSRKNMGNDAVASLPGTFSWEQAVFARPTPGVPFEFSYGYNSGIAQSGQPLEGGIDVFAEDSVLGRGWRHSFQTRMVAGSLFLQSNSAYVGLLTWDGGLETWQRQAGGTFLPVHTEYRGEMREVQSGDYIEWTTPDRMVFRFYHPTNWPDALLNGRLASVRDFNGIQIVLHYDQAFGRLASVNDTGGGVWTFNYSPQGLLTTVTGPSSNPAQMWTVTFTFSTVTVSGQPQNVLSTKTITPPSTTTYPLPVINRTTLTPTGSTQWQFFYSGGAPTGLLNRLVDPRGNNDVQVTYDTFGRKTQEYNALGRYTTYKYNVPALRQLTTTEHFSGTTADPVRDRTSVETFDRKLRVLARKDPLGFVASYEYDAAGNVTAMTDPRGARSVMTYDARSNLTSRSNALGETTSWEYAHVLSDGTLSNKPTKETRPVTAEAPGGWENRYEYDPAGNLRFHRDGPWPTATPFRVLAEHRYGARGLVESSFDANGNETRFAYDLVTGFLTSRTIAFGTPQAATWTFTHTELGWPKTETNPLSEPTTLDYNVNGQVIATTDAISRTFTKAFDGNGNLVAESDGKGVNTTYVYNQADERTEKYERTLSPGATGFRWQFTYNPFGELESTITPTAVSDGSNQTLTSTRIYDLNGRVVEDRDPTYSAGTPTLHRIAYEYDANGNQTAMIDKVGKRWEKTFDALNRVIAERDPEGNVRRTSFDAAGRVLVVTSPNGFPSSHEYDGRSRLTKWKDPEGYEWLYTYDGVGNILDIEDALHGHYVMTYGPRNERLTERNQDLKQWTYTYDALVRLATQTNPPGTGAGPGGGPVVRTLNYDQVGRLEYVTFNTGRTNALGYDNNNNVRSVVRTGGAQPNTSLYLDYDALDRLTESRDAFGKTVGYGYDALSRVVTKTYPGGKVLTHSYDRLSRLTALAFTGVAAPCTFAYDDAGRLTQRTYPNDVSQTNAFDDAGRLESLGYAGAATPPIALGYAYDRNGNKTGGSETGTLAWKTADIAAYDESATFKPDGKLITRTDALSPRDFSYTYDDAGNLTQAAAPGETYAITYDEDNRTASLTWDVGMTSKEIVNRYDALGRRISRKLDGTETRYVLDLMGGMERILCDTDASGVIKAWYIHGPDLCFKITDTGVLTCYHADAQGNIVRTTGPTGATINQYAYTPYGRAIDTNPVSAITDPSDPYRFVGSQGVMLEFPSIASSNHYFMRARYYSGEAAVFFATDPIRNVGPGWKPEAYGYAKANPASFSDPTGLFAVTLEGV
jgi:RHS repeat-associated protein